MDDEGGHALYPVEFLSTLSVTGIPPHVLRLRVGSIVLLLRNLNLKRGLCNGVRMLVHMMEQHVLEVELLTGPSAGFKEFIPRIEHRLALSQMPINFVRKQFPVQLAFAMTINKSQGQTFDKLGLWLQRPVFTHGQLYVALSRVRSKGSLFVKLPNGMTSTRNVVYRGAILGEHHPVHEDHLDIDLPLRGDHDGHIIEGEFADEYALGEEIEAEGYFDDV